MKIYQVTNVLVYRSSTSPFTLSIHATGLAATSGWSSPQLDNSADTNPADDVHEFAFVATKPSGIVLQVLTPITATIDFKPAQGASAVVVSSRTNSITVHSSEFITAGTPPVSTMAFGEEGVPPWHKWPTGRHPLGEQTTMAFGEEGPRPFPTSPMTDDPMPPIFPRDPWVDPWGPLRGGGIFGNY